MNEQDKNIMIRTSWRWEARRNEELSKCKVWCQEEIYSQHLAYSKTLLLYTWLTCIEKAYLIQGTAQTPPEPHLKPHNPGLVNPQANQSILYTVCLLLLKINHIKQSLDAKGSILSPVSTYVSFSFCFGMQGAWPSLNRKTILDVKSKKIFFLHKLDWKIMSS